MEEFEVTLFFKSFLKTPEQIEIHGFCDASQVGYRACLYVTSTNQVGEITVRLSCAKSRVAPLKTLTIPQLELCGALTLARLYFEVRPAFNFSITRVIFWSDSTIVLQWLKKEPQVLKVFESNRVRKIQTLGNDVEWRQVATKNNPADALSRGQLPAEFLKNESWFCGPSWLKEPEENWPKGIEIQVRDLPGLKQKTCLLINSINSDIYHRFSSYQTMVKTIAYCLRMRPSNIYKTKNVGVQEKNETERVIIKIIQNEQFADSITRLSLNKVVKDSRLTAFNPFHQHAYHAGIQSTLYTMRQRF